MAEKDVARKADFEAHKKADPTVVHGIVDVVRSLIAAAINSLWRDSDTDITTGFYVQSGTKSVPAGGNVTVTFDVEFAEAPRVVATAVTTENFSVTVQTITTTTFKMYGVNSDSGTAHDCNWIAIGRIAR